MRKFGIEDLARCRERIDRLDLELLNLLNQRTGVVEEIGQIKRQIQMAIYEPKREDQVFANIAAHNHGPLSDEAVKRIFERIIDEMRTVQQMIILEQERERGDGD